MTDYILETLLIVAISCVIGAVWGSTGNASLWAHDCKTMHQHRDGDVVYICEEKKHE